MVTVARGGIFIFSGLWTATSAREGGVMVEPEIVSEALKAL
jgi:hypothetical protein